MQIDWPKGNDEKQHHDRGGEATKLDLALFSHGALYYINKKLPKSYLRHTIKTNTYFKTHTLIDIKGKLLNRPWSHKVCITTLIN